MYLILDAGDSLDLSTLLASAARLEARGKVESSQRIHAIRANAPELNEQMARVGVRVVERMLPALIIPATHNEPRRCMTGQDGRKFLVNYLEWLTAEESAEALPIAHRKKLNVKEVGDRPDVGACTDFVDDGEGQDTLHEYAMDGQR